jgi:hypothetical protein
MHLFLKTALLLLLTYTFTISAINDSTKAVCISENGVGPINDKTNFDRIKIGELFPKCIVEKITRATEGEEFPALQIIENGDVLFVINPDINRNSIFSIEIKSSRIRNESGPGIGCTYSQVFKDSLSSDCTAGNEGYSGFVLCRDIRSKHVYYLFSGEYDGPDNELPPLNILRTWKIKEIIWKPR